MSRLAITFGLAVLAFAGAATAQSVRLTADEARAELFGVRLSGVHEPSGEPWEECIEPSGRTVFRFEGAVDEGRLTITDSGQACFTYASTEHAYASCFDVEREGRRYRFEAFVTQRVERNVSACGSGDAIIAGRSAANG